MMFSEDPKIVDEPVAAPSEWRRNIRKYASALAVIMSTCLLGLVIVEVYQSAMGIERSHNLGPIKHGLFIGTWVLIIGGVIADRWLNPRRKL